MVSIGDIPLSNTHDRPLVSIIVQVEQLDRRTSSGRSPNNAQASLVPDEVLRPPLATCMEEWHKHVRLWVTSFEAIPTPLVAIAAGQGQVIRVI
jgi:hypothetical protein